MAENTNREFAERKKRATDAIEMREPDRVPLIPVMEAFPIYYGGGTIKDILYDYRNAEACFDKFFQDFKPDLG
jgi:hypothetical protein